MENPDGRCRRSVFLGSNLFVPFYPFVGANCFDLQAGFGVEALKQVIPKVGSMLLPNHESDSRQATHLSSSNQSKLPSSLLGPAFVLRVMAQNGKQPVVTSVVSPE